MNLRVAVLALGLIVSAGAVTPAPAQPQPAPARFPVIGTVQDQTGGMLAGATVTLVGPTQTPDRVVKADAAGRFKIDDVVAGAYELRAEYEGFKPALVRLKVGPRAPGQQKLVLQLAGLTQEITVGDKPVSIDAAQNRNTITVDKKLLADLPIFDRDPVAALSRFLDPAAGGATLVVDGMEARKIGVSASAIKQIKINQDPYAAEFGRPGQGRIEVTTEAGSEAYHGEFNVTFRDGHLNARNAFETTTSPEQRRIFEGSLSGPIGSGKTTSFLLTADREAEDLWAIVYAATPTGVFQTIVPTPVRTYSLSGTVNHQVGKKHTLSLRVTYASETVKNEGVGGTTLPEAASHSSDQEGEIIYTQRTILSPKLINQVRFLYGQDRVPTVSVTRLPKIVVQDAFTGGGAQADSLDTERHFTLNESLTWSAGTHLVKGGLLIPDWSWRHYIDRSNYGGTFSFSSLDDYTAGKPYMFAQQQGDPELSLVQKILALYVQDEISVRKNLAITMGLRYDWQNFYGDSNNLAPRLSFAWAPGTKGTTVLRGGVGLFNDRLSESPMADVIRSREGRTFRYVLLDPGYPDPTGAGSSIDDEPTSLVQLEPGMVIPHSLQFSAGIDRQMWKGTTLSVNYIESHGFRMMRSRDINAPPPPLYVERPDPAHGVIRQIESTAGQESRSLQVVLRGKFTRYFNGSVQYVFGRAFNDTNGIGSFPANNYDLTGEWSRSSSDERHRFDLVGSINGGRWFTIGVAFSARSGRPYTMRIGRDVYNNGTTNARPPGVPRNSLQATGSANLDLRWSHTFALTKAEDEDEGMKINVGVDAFNVLNRVNYTGWVGNLSSPFYGQPTSAQAARRFQLTARFEF